MTDQTIVAVFDTAAHAQAAHTALLDAGVPKDGISMRGQPTEGASPEGSPTIGGFWSSLFGGEADHDTAVYDRSIAAGSTVISVKVPEVHVQRVMDLLEQHNPIDIDERAASYGLSSTTVSTTVAQPGMSTSAMPASPAVAPRGTEASLQLAEETLAVGKRVVKQGGTRIRRYVVETPVEENVSLHSEKVVLERHPVTDGRVVADSFSDKSIEMLESAEEAVVSKTARVYEEVGLRKEVSDHVETIRDTVRKEEVEVVQVPGAASVSNVKPQITQTTTTAGAKLPPKV